MKRYMLPLALAITLLLLTATAVSADTPPGVAPALRMDSFGCYVGHYGAYWGDGVQVFSNGNTGHTTWKCKFELVPGSGTGGYYYSEFEFMGCDNTLSIEGQKGMWTMQCFAQWYP